MDPIHYHDTTTRLCTFVCTSMDVSLLSWGLHRRTTVRLGETAVELPCVDETAMRLSWLHDTAMELP